LNSLRATATIYQRGMKTFVASVTSHTVHQELKMH